MSAQGDYVSKYREFKYNETLFELFAKQFEIAKVDEAREGAVIQILDAAQPPERKSKPKKVIIAIIATLAAGFALLLFVFIRQSLINSGKDQESANKLIHLKASWQKAIGKA
jgi:tyrosine-protein kinase Etk/Wzc